MIFFQKILKLIIIIIITKHIEDESLSGLRSFFVLLKFSTTLTLTVYHKTFSTGN
jgi:hypothetical protein